MIGARQSWSFGRGFFFEHSHCRLIQPLLGLLLFAFANGVVGSELPSAAGGGVITNLAQIRWLSRAEAAKAHPVCLRGVVTWQQAENHAFVLDDGTQAVYADVLAAQRTGGWTGGFPPIKDTEPGAVIELEGVTDPGGYAPVVLCTRLKRLGSASQTPRHLGMDSLISGSADALWVEVEGVVQSVDEYPVQPRIIRLLVAGQVCRVAFEHETGLNPAALIDAKVRVRGALASVFNMRSEVVGVKLSANGVQDMDILSPPSPDVFQGPPVALNQLRLFSPDADAAFHRKHTQGVVNFVLPQQFFFLQDGFCGVKVESSDAGVQVGEKVELAGFVDPARNIAALNGVTVRRLGASPITSVATTAREILHPVISDLGNFIAVSDLNYRLVRLPGRLVQVDRGDNGVEQLLVESDGHFFKALLPQSSFRDSLPPTTWVTGSELELTGACELEYKEDPRHPSITGIADFRLWLRSPADVLVLHPPSWGTVRQLRMILVGALVVIIAGGFWGLTLQRLLKKRTDRLQEVISLHRNVELEFTAARRERLRLAADLHDGLKQLIAAAAFRLEAAEGHLSESPQVAAKHLASAHTTLIRTQEELQECMQGLHVLEEGPPELDALLRQVFASTDHWPKDVIQISRRGTVRDLPRDVAGSLLLLFQEAVSNALNHGHASQIQVVVDYTAKALVLEIRDNGSGFDPAMAAGVNAGHFGLNGMRRRVKWLQGDFSIARHPGGGMLVSVRIPWSVIPHAERQPSDPSGLPQIQS